MNLALLRMSALEVLNVEAGWSAVARFSTTQIEPPRTVAAAMLEETRVLVHPGIFYGLADSKAIVISLLAPADRMQAAMERLRTVFGA
jgi:alanine-synthesizing transaminase